MKLPPCGEFQSRMNLVMYSGKVITKCDGIITNCDRLVYYKVRWTVVANCDSFFITKCDAVYYKLRQVLQSATDLLQIATGITKCDGYYKLRRLLKTTEQSITLPKLISAESITQT